MKIDLTEDEYNSAMSALVVRRSAMESGLACLAYLAKYVGRDSRVAEILGTKEAHESAIAALDAVIIKFRQAKLAKEIKTARVVTLTDPRRKGCEHLPQCPNDTDGDGNCHLCHNRGGCAAYRNSR